MKLFSTAHKDYVEYIKETTDENYESDSESWADKIDKSQKKTSSHHESTKSQAKPLQISKKLFNKPPIIDFDSFVKSKNKLNSYKSIKEKLESGFNNPGEWMGRGMTMEELRKFV